MSDSNPAHTHRFDNLLIRYDKENDKCVIKKVISANAPYHDMELHIIDLIKFKNSIESTKYFKELNNRGESLANF